MSRIRIEGLLAAFPKLVGTGPTGKQHTYVETENVRYVYQPIEALYLLLVTNKQSNILEDLDTLRLLSKIVSFLTSLVYLLSLMHILSPLIFSIYLAVCMPRFSCLVIICNVINRHVISLEISKAGCNKNSALLTP